MLRHNHCTGEINLNLLSKQSDRILFIWNELFIRIRITGPWVHSCIVNKPVNATVLFNYRRDCFLNLCFVSNINLYNTVALSSIPADDYRARLGELLTITATQIATCTGNNNYPALYIKMIAHRYFL